MKEENPSGENIISGDIELACKEPEFAKAFIEAVPDEEEQRKYLFNSSLHGLGRKGYDEKYVLYFRRTLPSKEPKPENRWTDNFVQVRNGLKKEIPEGPHRFYSVILCDSLEHLSQNGKDTEIDANTDGEIVVHRDEYNQNECVCSFKPQHEQEALAKYQKKEDAMGLGEVLKKVKDYRSQRDAGE